MKALRYTAAVLAAMLLMLGFPRTARAAYDLPYYIEVDLSSQIVTVYRTADDSVVHQMLCSAGLLDYTPRGTFYLPKTSGDERKEWYYFSMYSCYAHYATRIVDYILFHSIPYSERDESTISQSGIKEFGNAASHGCVRLLTEDAKFIAENCGPGTRVKIFKSRKENQELRTLLYRHSYTGEDGLTYKEYLGMTDDETALGLKSKGQEVKDLQYRLRDLGIYDGELDGEYMAATINAVKDAQKLLGMPETGVATREFREIIFSPDAPVDQGVKLREGMSGPAVRDMQQRLKTLKLYDGDIDSVFDVDVVEAVKAFQAAYGYASTGEAGTEMQKALKYEAEKLGAILEEKGDCDLSVADGMVTFGMVSCDIGIRVRSAATSRSDPAGHLDNGDVVVILQNDGEWSRVQRGTIQGYVKNIYLKIADQPVARLGYALPDGAEAYSIGFTPREYLSGAMRPTDTFKVYLASGQTQPSEPVVMTYATVRTAAEDVRMNLRQGPGTDTQVLAELAYGTKLPVRERGEAWTLVEYEGVEGYLMNDFLVYTEEVVEEAPAQSQAQAFKALVKTAAQSGAPAYDGVEDDANVLGHLRNGIEVEVLDSMEGWNLIRYKDQTGYMRDEDLDLSNRPVNS